MSTPFLRIFKLYQPEERCAETASSLLVDSLSGDRQSRSITVHATSDKPVSSEILGQVELAIRTLYGLDQFSISLNTQKLVLSPACLPQLFL